MPELLEIAKSVNEKENREREFLAALEGIELSSKKHKTFEDVKREAFGDNVETNDIANLKGELAKEAGFGVGLGIGYIEGE